MMQSLLMDTLTPLGVLYYGTQLWWWRWAQRNLMRKNPAHPDINEQVHAIRELEDILGRKRLA